MVNLTIDFMDIGQGDCTFIRCPTGEAILIDCGSVKDFSITGPSVFTYLKNVLAPRPILDYIFLSHGDKDHYNKLVSLFDYMRAAGYPLSIGYLVYGGKIEDYGVDSFGERVIRPLEASGNAGPLSPALYDKYDSPPRFVIGNLKIWLLSANQISADKNASSIVLLLQYHAPNGKIAQIILPGDAPGEVENLIIEKNDSVDGKYFLLSDVLKLAHHGSNTEGTNSKRWVLETVKPEYAFVSSGEHMGYKMPYCEFLVSNITPSLTESVEHNVVCYGAGWEAYSTTKGLYTTMISRFEGTQHQLIIDEATAALTVNVVG